MKKHLSITLLSLLTLAIFGCASHNMALEDARKSFQNASSDPSVRANAPVALHDADLALQQANKAYNDGEKASEVSHLADLASKRVEIARVQAQGKLSENQFQEVSKDRANAVNVAREKETTEARATSAKLTTANQQLENAAVQNQAQTTVLEAQTEALNAKNADLSRQLADLKMKPTARGMELTLRDTVFEFGKSDLAAGSRRDLEKISSELKNATGRRILIEGHTDSIGTDQFNDGLSQRRAEAVRDILAKDTDPSLITARGLGKLYPVASNATEAGRQQNRRVTIIVSNDSADNTNAK